MIGFLIHLCVFIYLFIFKRFYLFIFRERGREREREGEKHQCVVAPPMPPTGDLACNPAMCPDAAGNWTGDPLLRSLMLSPLNHTSQASFVFLTMLLIFFFLCWKQVLFWTWRVIFGRHQYEKGGKEWRICGLCISPLFHCPTGLHLENTSWEIKLLRISRLQQQSIKPSVGYQTIELVKCPRSWPWMWEQKNKSQ